MGDAKACPVCGAEKEMDVLVGLCGNEWGDRYHCGTIYWPSQNRITVRGAACKIISSLRAQLEEAMEEIKALERQNEDKRKMLLDLIQRRNTREWERDEARKENERMREALEIVRCSPEPDEKEFTCRACLKAERESALTLAEAELLLGKLQCTQEGPGPSCPDGDLCDSAARKLREIIRGGR
jgi:regulator of replication initiation timing